MIKQNLNSSKLTFPRDEKLHFEESTHTYTVDGLGIFTSVSNIISQFFKPFDAEGISLRKCHDNPIAAAALREEWAAKGQISSVCGTHMHAQIENFLNTGAQPKLDCHVEYHGDYVQLDKHISIATEWEYFQRFCHENQFTPFRTEWGVYDDDTRMAGTIDLLCECPDGTYEIFDWKRSNRIDPQEVNRWNSGINGLEFLSDTVYHHYCLQQNLYRYILERNYGIAISRMNLVVLHPDYPSYRRVLLPRMDKEIDIIVARLLSTLNS